MQGQADIFEALSCGRPWVGAVANQPSVLCGIGLSDPFLRAHISGPECTRYSTGAFTFTLSVVGPLADLIIATGANITLFQDGLGDVGTVEGLWWPLTTGDTNLTQGGNPIDLQLGFMATGMTVEVLDPYQRSGGGVATDVRYYNAFLRRGLGYNEQIKAAVLNNVGVQVAMGNLGIVNRLGVLAQYPQWGGDGPNGKTASPMTYQPFQAAFLLGAQNSMSKLAMLLTFGQAVTVGNIAAVPVQTTTTAGAPLSPATAPVSQPVRVALAGYIVCVPQDILCGVPVAYPKPFMDNPNFQAPAAPGAVPTAQIAQIASQAATQAAQAVAAQVKPSGWR